MSLVRFRLWALSHQRLMWCVKYAGRQQQLMQVWFNGRTSAFQAEYVGSIPITCSQLLNLESWYGNILYIIYARVAQLVEHDLAKVGAAGSSPVSRSREVRKTLILRAFLMPKSVQIIFWTEVGQIRQQNRI